jgi:hypothetical protein
MMGKGEMLETLSERMKPASFPQLRSPSALANSWGFAAGFTVWAYFGWTLSKLGSCAVEVVAKQAGLQAVLLGFPEDLDHIAVEIDNRVSAIEDVDCLRQMDNH